MTAARPYAEVIGDPVAHSKSPAIHNFWLERLDIAADYRAHHVLPPNLAAYVAERTLDPGWRGCNVTLPHKLAVLDHVADPGGVRQSIGAANTLYRSGGETLGVTNTDPGGFLAPILDRDWSGRHAAVIGSGGAARAVLFALQKMDIGRVTLIARSGLKGAGLLAHFGLKGAVQDFDAALPVADLLVNASPLGMAGQEQLALDLSPLPHDAFVYDLVYAPVETALLRAAEQDGLETVSGLAMLIGQAALAFELFFGVAPPEGDEDALLELLQR